MFEVQKSILLQTGYKYTHIDTQRILTTKLSCLACLPKQIVKNWMKWNKKVNCHLCCTSVIVHNVKSLDILLISYLLYLQFSFTNRRHCTISFYNYISCTSNINLYYYYHHLTFVICMSGRKKSTSRKKVFK